MKDIDERIDDLEKNSVRKNGVPGTQIVRVLLEDGIGWSLVIGALGEPKKFYTAKTIEDVLDLAERDH